MILRFRFVFSTYRSFGELFSQNLCTFLISGTKSGTKDGTRKK